jgi:hypothetical protein
LTRRRSGSDGPAVLDVRTYALVAGASAEFHALARDRAVPMLKRYGIWVVAYGPSADDEDMYYLVRAFDSRRTREQQLSSFYGSDEWRRDCEPAVLCLIRAYHVAVIELSAAVADSLAAVSTSARNDPASRAAGRP